MSPSLFIVARKGSGDVGGVDGWGVRVVAGYKDRAGGILRHLFAMNSEASYVDDK